MAATWVLVANGTQARVLISENLGKELREVTILASEEAGKLTHELGTDRPGREFASVGTNRSAMEPPTDLQRHAKQEFAQRIARFLQGQKGLDRLVIAASPKTLGDLREVLNEKVRGKIIAEIHKDLLHFSAHDLSLHLAEIIKYREPSVDPVKQRRFPSVSKQ